jgi:hypothetical protein
MTYAQWKAQAIGQPIDIDHAYGDQCVDVYLDYIQKVLGVQNWASVSGYGNAKDMINTYNPAYFDKLIPANAQQGDVIVYGPTATNSAGHIAIVDSVNGTSVTVIEQNGFNPTGVCYVTTRSYANSLGLLRIKGGHMSTIIDASLVDVLRIGHSEIGGWDYYDTHSGKNDALYLNAWKGRPVEDFIRAQWSEPNAVKFRDARLQAFADSPVLKKQVADDKVLIDNLQKQITDLQAQSAIHSTDTVNLNALGVALKWLISRLGLK